MLARPCAGRAFPVRPHTQGDARPACHARGRYFRDHHVDLPPPLLVSPTLVSRASLPGGALNAPRTCASHVAGLSTHQFRELFEREGSNVLRFLLRLTRNRSDADDLLQETFLTVWRKRDQFEGRGAVEGWLKRTAWRTYLNARTLRERRTRLAAIDEQERAMEASEPPADSGPEQRDAHAFLAAKIRAAVDELPEPAREAFVLFRFEGLTCAQIASLTDTPLKTVETRVARATKLLAERLRPFRDNVPLP